jgi:hypothetical protein
MIRYLLVEVRVGHAGIPPTSADWGAYTRVRDMIGLIATDPEDGSAEVGQVLELTTSGMKNRYGFIHPLPESVEVPRD